MADTILTDDARLRSYTATAGQTSFSVPFAYASASEMAVQVTDANGIVTAPTFTMSPAGPADNGALVLDAALVGGESVIVYGDGANLPVTQFGQSTGIPASKLNQEFVNVMKRVQELARGQSRALRLPIGEAAPELATLVGVTKGYLAIVDGAIVWSPGSETGSAELIAAQQAAETAKLGAETAKTSAEVARNGAQAAESASGLQAQNAASSAADAGVSLTAIQSLIAALPSGTVVYQTKSAMDAVTPTPPALAYVLDDNGDGSASANNGLYGWPTGGSAWTKDASDLNDRLTGAEASLSSVQSENAATEIEVLGLQNVTSAQGIALPGDAGLSGSVHAVLDSAGVPIRVILADGTVRSSEEFQDEIQSATGETIDAEVAAGTVSGEGVLLFGVLKRSGLVSGLRQEAPSGLAYLTGSEGSRAARALMRDGSDILLSPAISDVSRLVQNGDSVSFYDEGDEYVVDQGLWDASAALAAGVTTVYFVPVYGQSNGGAFGSRTRVVTAAPDAPGRSLSFSHGVSLARVYQTEETFSLSELSHLIDASELHGPGQLVGESPCCGLGWALAAELASTAAVVTGSFAIGGNAIAGAPGLGLNKGTFGYQSILMAARRLKVICDLAGLDLIVPAVAWFQGESNGGDVYATYDGHYVQLQSDFDADLKAITGQTEEVLLAAHQISAWTLNNTSIAGNPVFVQLDRAVSEPARFLCSGVNYIYTHLDGIHSDADGKRAAGEILGRAIGRRIADSVTHPMLYISSAARSGNVITLTYAGAEGALVFDSSVDDPGDRGFVFSQTGGTLPSISSVAISGSTVVVTLSGTPDGTDQTITYAGNTTASGNGAGGGTTGPRGQLRDSSNAVGADSSARYKWAQHQRITVS